MASTRGQTTKFVQNETVLCYEPDTDKARVLYESKVLEVDFTKDEKGRRVPEYYIHFSGWNKSWDRWVTEDQVLRNNEANRVFMAKTHDIALKALKKRKRSVHSESNDSKSAKTTGGDETKKCSTSSEAESSASAVEVQIEIPSQLKLKLEDDCYFIKRRKKLVSLPRNPNIVQVLSDYHKHFISLSHEDPSLVKSTSLVREVLDGLRIYFDFTLPTLLLYNMEKEQYREVMRIRGDLEMSSCSSSCSNLTESLRTSADKPQDNDHVTETQNVEKYIKQEKTPNRILRRRTSGAPTTPCPSTSSDAAEQLPEIITTLKRKRAQETESTMMSSLSNQMPSSSFPSGLSTNSLLTPSQVYGTEHLLRLFVKLPGLLSRTTMEEKNLKLLLQQIEDFLRYLADRSDVLLTQDVYIDSDL